MTDKKAEVVEQIQGLLSDEQWKAMTTKDALAYWIALPFSLRVPKKQKDLAAIMGVSEEMLCKIKRHEEFNALVIEYRKVFFKQFTSNIINALKNAAEGGDMKAAKLFLQYVEDFREVTRQETQKTERREFVFIIGEDRWTELRKKLKENFEKQEYKYLQHQKISLKEDEEAEEAEIIEERED